jgi:hypothetical protein
MILYHTTQNADAFASAGDRDHNTVARQWFDANHFTFAAEPLAGYGPYVYSIEVPTSVVEPFMFSNIHRRERASHYALPRQVVVDSQPTRETYHDLTGSAWNSFLVDVMDRRPRKGETDLVGMWSLVWISREGIAKARVAERKDDLLTLQIETTSEFDPTKDYVVLEEHEEFLAGRNEPPKETWALFTLAGQAPQWQIFPTAWQNWVSDASVAQSAIAYMMRMVPEVQRDIEYAQHLESKHNRARAWRNVADQMATLLSRQLRRSVDLGKFAGHSWTAVLAIPLRIAMRLGAYVGEEWVPPLPKPEFQHPESSGRVLLANNYGAYPSRGPGVDHVPQDRPYEKRQSELRKVAENRRPNFDPTTQANPRW